MKIDVWNVCPRCLFPGNIVIDTDKFNEKNTGITKCSECHAFIASYTKVTDGSSKENES